MKGPRSRHRHNVLRIWECSRCKRRAFAPPQVTTHVCRCNGEDRPTWMTLIDPPMRRRPTPLPAQEP